MDDAATLLARYQPQELTSFQTDQQVFAARFSPCGNFLAAGGFDSTVRRWNAELKMPEPPAEAPDPKAKRKAAPPKIDPPQQLSSLTGHGGWVQGLAFSPQGEFLYSADSWGKLCAWRYADENPQPVWSVDSAHDGWIQMVAVSPNGELVATVGNDRMVRVFDAATGAKRLELAGHTDIVFAVAFHPSGKTLVSGDLRAVIKEWSIPAGDHTRDIDASALYKYDRIQEVGGVRVLTFDADGGVLAAGGTEVAGGGSVTGSPTLLLIDYESAKTTQKIVLGTRNDVYIHDVCFHPGGFLIIGTSGTPGNGKFICHRPGDEKPFFEHTKISNVHGVSLHPNGTRVAVTGTNRSSAGNGRRTGEDGEYANNVSPIHLFDLGPQQA